MADPDLTTTPNTPDFLLGVLALWLGLAVIVLRWFQAAGLFVLLVSPVLLFGYIFGGEFGFSVANLLLSPISLSFLVYFGFVFAFPAYVDVVRLCGLFLQRCAYVRPADTVGAVTKRWERVRGDYRRLRSYLLARP